MAYFLFPSFYNSAILNNNLVIGSRQQDVLLIHRH